jgi:hypothetical protein
MPAYAIYHPWPNPSSSLSDDGSAALVPPILYENGGGGILPRSYALALMRTFAAPSPLAP